MFVATLLFASAPAEAADPVPKDESEVPAGRTIKYLKRTELIFGDELELKGELVKPGGIIVQGRTPTSFHPLIRLRKDWNEEMVASIANVE